MQDDAHVSSVTPRSTPSRLSIAAAGSTALSYAVRAEPQCLPHQPRVLPCPSSTATGADCAWRPCPRRRHGTNRSPGCFPLPRPLLHCAHRRRRTHDVHAARMHTTRVSVLPHVTVTIRRPLPLYVFPSCAAALTHDCQARRLA